MPLVTKLHVTLCLHDHRGCHEAGARVLAAVLINMGVKAFAGRMAESSRPLGRQRHFLGFIGLTFSNMIGEFRDGG